MSAITPMLSNDELAQAIAATIEFARGAKPDSLSEQALFAHLKELLEAQKKRAQVMYCEAIGA